MYWPLTAGGLGLSQAMLLAATYAEGLARRQEVKPPQGHGDDWQWASSEWARYYDALLEEIVPMAPVQLQVMETLVDDFIERGGELTGGKQHKLSTYWRWILYTYGPQILADFGTFRFLITELVPLQLIIHKFGGGAGAEEQSGSESPAHDDIPF